MPSVCSVHAVGGGGGGGGSGLRRSRNRKVEESKEAVSCVGFTLLPLDVSRRSTLSSPSAARGKASSAERPGRGGADVGAP